MSYTLDSVFAVVSESVMLLAGQGSVKWIPLDKEDEKKGEPVTLDLAEFVMRSLAHTLVEGGEPYADVKKVADKYGVQIDDEDTSFSVIFKRLGGKRRLTRRKQIRK
jgi:hypothetical protein